MANRAYLYSRHPGESVEFRDIAEWASEVPPAHLILVGINPTVVKSAIWQVEEKIAIEGDASEARSVFLRLLDWLEPQVDKGFAAAANEARELLSREDRIGDKYHLELGEIYELYLSELSEMEKATKEFAEVAAALYTEVKRVLDLDQSTLDSFEHEMLRGITDWEQQFGLYFSHVLYFSLGTSDKKAEEDYAPPVEIPQATPSRDKPKPWWRFW